MAGAYLWSRTTGKVERLDVNDAGGGGRRGHPGLLRGECGGRYVVFVSKANNLAPGFESAPPWPEPYLYLRDRQLGTTRSLIFDLSGLPGNPAHWAGGPFISMSNDGRLVAFNACGNLVPGVSNTDQHDAYLWDAAARFYDLPSVYWAFPSVEACVSASIVNGYPDGTYHPIEAVNRAQMAVFIARALGRRR